MKRKTDWVEIKINDDRYRLAVTASNLKRMQGRINVEKYLGEKSSEKDWVKVGWNGIIKLFNELSKRLEANR